MQYPFRASEKYFTEAEQKHLDKFLTHRPIPKDTWNVGNEQRKILRVDFPEGMVIPGETAYMTNEKTGEKFFHTPCAKVGGKLGRVIYMVGKEMKTATSEEWLADIAGGYTVDPAIVPEKSEAQRQIEAATVGMLARNTPKPNFDEYGPDMNKKTEEPKKSVPKKK